MIVDLFWLVSIKICRICWSDIIADMAFPRRCRSPPSTGISTQSGSEPATDGGAPGDQEELEKDADSGDPEEEQGGSEGGGEGRKENVTSKPQQSSEVYSSALCLRNKQKLIAWQSNPLVILQQLVHVLLHH